eukprot:2292339-Amphidinium_carterae.1
MPEQSYQATTAFESEGLAPVAPDTPTADLCCHGVIQDREPGILLQEEKGYEQGGKFSQRLFNIG